MPLKSLVIWLALGGMLTFQDATPPAQTEPEPTENAPLEVESPSYDSVISLIETINDERQEPAQPVVRYRIQARLDVEAKAIEATAHLTYTNLSPDVISDLQFHLYMNAFKNERSTYALERGGLIHDKDIDEHSYGYVDIQELEIGGRDALPRLQFIQPDDDNPHDRTVARIPLDEPLEPQFALEIKYRFTTKLPRVLDRTGFHRKTFFCAQWFPKLGVWETAGVRGRDEAGWNCHQFHAWGEFYANFGDYEVAIEVPDNYQVGASGHLMRVDEGPKIKTYTFSESRIHDFAWLASPDVVLVEKKFVPEEWITDAELEAVMKLHGLPLEDVKLAPIDVHLFMQPQHQSQFERHFRAVAQAIKYYGLWYGPYPYEDLTCFDPPFGADDMGGMEYPTLITMGTTWRQPAQSRQPEGVTIHEFGHQYWYGMVASNEFEESWLDEGFNTYSTGLVLDRVHSPIVEYLEFNHLFLDVNRLTRIQPYTPLQKARESLIQNNGSDSVVRNAWEYKNRSSYGANSYRKAVALLRQLESELGADTFARAMRIYFQRFQFKHPHSEDFRAVLEQVAGRDLSWFFDQFIYGHATIDFAVGTVSSQDLQTATGYLETDSGRSFVEDPMTKNKPDYVHRVTIENRGSGQYPVDIEFTFEDGHSERRSWDGAYPWKRFQFRYPAELSEIVIDPDQKILIDSNSFNNSYRFNSYSQISRTWSVRAFLTLQQILQTLSGVWS